MTVGIGKKVIKTSVLRKTIKQKKSHSNGFYFIFIRDSRLMCDPPN